MVPWFLISGRDFSFLLLSATCPSFQPEMVLLALLGGNERGLKSVEKD